MAQRVVIGSRTWPLRAGAGPAPRARALASAGVAVLPLALPAAAALGLRLLSGPHTIDDAYITFRYARNLAAGLGLVYNPGEWVLGTTAPLWAILLAAGDKLGLTDLPWLATLLAATCDAATAALLAHWSRRLGWTAWGGLLVGLAWAANPMSIGFATGGMETSLFILLALIALGLAARGDRRAGYAAAAVGGLATLVRPEGALIVAAVAGWRFLACRRDALPTVLCGLGPMLAAGLVLLARYGSPLPNSIVAKQVAYRGAAAFDNLAAFLVQAGLPGWSTYLLASLPPLAGVLLASLGIATLAILVWRGLPRLQRGGVIWQPFVLFGVLYVAFYASVGVRGVRLFPWYLVPIEPLYLLGAAAGLRSLGPSGAAGLASLGRGGAAGLGSFGRGGAAGLGSFGRGAWLAGLLVLWQLPALSWQPLLPRGEDLGREQALLEVGYQLRATLPPDALVAAPEIGALGYASNLPILDTVGLVSPAALPYYPLPADELVSDNAIPPGLIRDRQPQAVVTFDAFAQRSLLPDPAFARDYQLVESDALPVWQSQHLLVFRRVDQQRAD